MEIKKLDCPSCGATLEVDSNFYHDIYPKSYLGYWVNNETGEITTSWHV